MPLVSEPSVSGPCVQIMSWYSFHGAAPGNHTGFLFPSEVSELLKFLEVGDVQCSLFLQELSHASSRL